MKFYQSQLVRRIAITLATPIVLAIGPIIGLLLEPAQKALSVMIGLLVIDPGLFLCAAFVAKGLRALSRWYRAGATIDQMNRHLEIQRSRDREIQAGQLSHASLSGGELSKTSSTDGALSKTT